MLPRRSIAPILISALIMAALIGSTLLSGCGSDSPTTPTPTPPTGEIEANPDGILLPGDPDGPAIDAVVNMPASPAPANEIVDGLLTTRLMIWPSPTATVAELNAALETHDATIVSMRAALPLMTIRVPAMATAAEATARAEALMAEPAILLAITADAAQIDPIRDDKKVLPPEGSLSHLNHGRVPAAWNAAARASAVGAQVPVLVADYFASDDAHAEVPALTFEAHNRGSLSAGENHGIHVAGTIAARQGGTAAVGVHPDGGRVSLTGIPVQGLSWAEINSELIRRFPASGNFVISTSLGWGFDHADAIANNGNWTTQQLFNGAVLSLTWRMLTWQHWDRLVHATASGNEAEYAGTMNDGRRASPWCIARHFADPRTMFTAADGLTDIQNNALDTLMDTINTNFPAAAAALPNTIVVGSSDSAGNESVFSNHFADVRAGGELVTSVCVAVDDGCNGTLEDMSGTSMATPQVAGMVAWLWNLSPTLSSSQVVERALATYTRSDKPGLLNAYMLALSGDGSLATAPIRRAVLDVAGSSASPGSNGRFDEADIELFLTFFESHEAQTGGVLTFDHSRYDLNGDGTTGHGTRAAFDLDVDGVPSIETLSVDFSGQELNFNEASMSDRDVLCYYAISDLYQGDTEARNELLSDCLPSTSTGRAVLFTPDYVYPSQYGAQAFGFEVDNVVLDIDDTRQWAGSASASQSSSDIGEMTNSSANTSGSFLVTTETDPDGERLTRVDFETGGNAQAMGTGHGIAWAATFVLYRGYFEVVDGPITLQLTGTATATGRSDYRAVVQGHDSAPTIDGTLADRSWQEPGPTSDTIDESVVLPVGRYVLTMHADVYARGTSSTTAVDESSAGSIEFVVEIR